MADTTTESSKFFHVRVRLAGKKVKTFFGKPHGFRNGLVKYVEVNKYGEAVFGGGLHVVVVDPIDVVWERPCNMEAYRKYGELES